ncbi:hypothetical protein GLOIN_2v1773372 [Rhizophagus irregularis DAOM 181602=DAOM 197198]|uniref:Crinkler effector protein N-terminal domain-containing protein n=1 Tax=Rhizophagus irregularis (strain DAOM 181602 / DAOM 197198 / MUCL 43194) TaxID=747089 RepID=A0A2P4Q559_RHIID|nr:hypothetical protein GLOIN_2v1773372 [Rhizophagus irregularis DAOM 181602=DAOM 197198]POG72732.1 hypothetical protein GLOIN_2v1773372 [Rhizophagus irregularis DAOM 181602=DAOM 197198]|eukprot:XP_025179598.1 hypothetical protein GLOIN_2v1773372 [Rhizophagus irregularis DAOM 181602=DAOM 197198]
MPTITLNCLVVGENPYEIAFNIKMNLTKTVSELKEEIKTKKQAFRIPASRRPVKAKRTIVIEAMVGVLQLIGKPSYNFKFKLATTTTNITTLGKALSDDSELGGIARRFLRQNEFFENDKAKLYFLRKKRKDEVKICTETTLSMANERLGVTNEIAHQNSLDRLKEIAEKESLSDEGDYEEPGDEDKPSKENPRQVFLSKSRVATPKPCYFDGLPIHAGYSLMAEDWITDGVNLSNNLKGTGLVSKRFHQQVSEGFENVWVELKGGVGTRHESENSNNREDIDVVSRVARSLSTIFALITDLQIYANLQASKLAFHQIRSSTRSFDAILRQSRQKDFGHDRILLHHGMSCFSCLQSQ